MESFNLKDLPEGYSELNLDECFTSTPFDGDVEDRKHFLMMETEGNPHKVGESQPYKFTVEKDKEEGKGIKKQYIVEMWKRRWLSVDEKYGRWHREYKRDFKRQDRRAKDKIEDLFEEAYEQEFL